MSNSIEALAGRIRAYAGPPLRLMEVCGTHTRQLSLLGIPQMLPPHLSLISGPGCPVCVTPAGYIDTAAGLALRPHSTLMSFGDMLRVPGNRTSLLEARARGGSVRLMYSPMDAIGLALAQPDHTFHIAAVGFETTLPLYALLLECMRAQNIKNIRLLMAVKALLPALEWIGESLPQIDGFIGPGHVSAILGLDAYAPLCARYRIPLAVAGFSYEHLIAAIYDLMRQAEAGKCEAHNLYPGAVQCAGNAQALALIERYFVRVDTLWRGLGPIAHSGYQLAPEFAEYETSCPLEEAAEPSGCLCGHVITGQARPVDCPHFGVRCTPERPLGPCMVSSEGACGIWHTTARTK